MTDELDDIATQLKSLYESAENHPARGAMQRWRSWGIVANMMRHNQTDLLHHIDAPGSDSRLAIELVQNVRETGVAQAFGAETYRLLHNYLASVATLIEHSRIHLRKYDGQKVFDQYNDRVGRLRARPVAPFLKQFRNLVLHHGLPSIVSTLSFPGPLEQASSGDFTIRLSRDELLSSSEFTRPARDYLDQQEPEFLLRQPIVEYADLNDELLNWVDAQFWDLHGSEVDEYNQIVDRINEVRGR